MGIGKGSSVKSQAIRDQMRKRQSKLKPKRKPKAIDQWRDAFKRFFESRGMKIGKKWGNL